MDKNSITHIAHRTHKIQWEKENIQTKHTECTAHTRLNVTIYVLFTDQIAYNTLYDMVPLQSSIRTSNSILIIHALDINHFKLNGAF